MKFSIAIPAYKSLYLRDCINSILNQSIIDFELLILNDASPENVVEIVNSFSDSRIKYFENEINVGAENVVNNWNKLLLESSGEYFICLGDDDILLPNCLEEYLNLINKYPNLDIYHGWTEIIDATGKVVSLQEARPEYETVYSLIWHRWKGRNQFIGDFLFKTDTLKFVGGFFYLPLAWASDDITTFILAEKFGIANTQIPVFQYRVSHLTISSSGKTEVKLNALKSEIKWYQDFFNRIKSHSLIGTDIVYFNMLISEFEAYFRRKKVSLLRNYFLNNHLVSSLFYWFFNLNKYDLSYKIVLKAMLDSFTFSASSK